MKERGTPLFEADAGVRLLKSALPEYAGAIKDGRIVNIVEYQDARGFMQIGVKRLEALKAAVKDPDAAGDLSRALDAIMAAFPAIDPPEKPVKTAGAVSGLVSLVELSVSDIAAQ